MIWAAILFIIVLEASQPEAVNLCLDDNVVTLPRCDMENYE